MNQRKTFQLTATKIVRLKQMKQNILKLQA
jgi:hypothetical protein